MAVTKIRKVSSSTLLALSVISVIIFAVFFFGGAEVDAKGNKDYAYTGLLLFWTYALFLVTFAATAIFAVINFASNKKGLVSSLAGFGAFVALLVITYAIGDGTPISGLNDASQTFNTSGWLKVTDMWLYSIYVLFIVTLGAAIWGSVSKALKR